MGGDGLIIHVINEEAEHLVGIGPVDQAHPGDNSRRCKTASPAARVPSVPPRSWVVSFASMAAMTAFSMIDDSAAWPRYSSIIAAVRIAPIGLATSFPAYFGAEPWIGSNRETRPGWMLPDAAIPNPP